MMSKYRNAICLFGKYMPNNTSVMLGPINLPTNTPQQVRHIKKHWDPKFRKLRAQKIIKVELPNFEEDREEYVEPEVQQERVRSKLKKWGLFPQKSWAERPINITCTPQIYESYVVPEGDGKYSAVTKEGAKQKYQFIEKKSKSYLAVRKIKGYGDYFSVKTFPEQALDIYIKAHKALADRNTDKLIEYVTETAYPRMLHNIMNKTLHWKFLESLEPARVVHARCTNLLSDSNVFAQVTVRFHTQQILCIYDRFGRLLQGSEVVKKDVLEYIVFEKHMASEHGIWRIHGKIIPDWMTPTDEAQPTYVISKDNMSQSQTAV